jgi:hypothetical protein
VQNKYSKKHASHLRAADIIKRLPVHRSMSEAQSTLVLLTPMWNAWLNFALAKNFISSSCLKSANLTGWYPDESKLVISCDHATNASQIKHHAPHITDYLNKKLRDSISTEQLVETSSHPIKIKTIFVRISLHSAELPFANDSANKASVASAQTTINSSASFKPLSSSAIAALENCHKRVDNEKLAVALKTLTETLKSANQAPEID